MSVFEIKTISIDWECVWQGGYAKDLSREHSKSWHHSSKASQVWCDASNGSFWWENGSSVYGILQWSLIHFNICLICLIYCNAENAVALGYAACVFEMLVALWGVDWVLVATCDNPHSAVVAGCRMPKVDEHLCLLRWVWSDEFDSGGFVVQTRCWAQGILPVVAVCCYGCKTSLQILFSPTSAVVLSFSQCWVNPTLQSWV